MVPSLQTISLKEVNVIVYLLVYIYYLFIFTQLLESSKPNHTNLYAFAKTIKMSRIKKQAALCLLFSFIGVPPLFLFSAKFSLLAFLWNINTTGFFFMAFLFVFFSFALYVYLLNAIHENKKTQVRKQKKLKTKKKYENVSKLSFFLAFSFFGFVLFKDIVWVLLLTM